MNEHDPIRMYTLEELEAALNAMSPPEPESRRPSNANGQGRIPVVTLAALAPMVEGCDFIRWCRDHQAAVPEPLWYAMLSNLARCADGRDAAHAFSKDYPGYTHHETDEKFEHALTGSAPISCARIQELGFPGCPAAGHGVTSPAALGLERSAPRAEANAPPPHEDPQSATDPFAIGVGEFLGRHFTDPEPFIDGLLSDEGGGWIGGEEKLGKTYYALEEALCLALGLDVCGRFTVPVRRRVLFIEEEDPPRRTHRRLRALLRGHGLNPDDAALRADLSQWFRISVWSGFTLDAPAMVTRLAAELAAFTPHVAYLDVLRKITLKDLNKAADASGVLAALDDFRRRHGVLFRVLHHYRKSQGFRVGRGSQEIGGSFVLGAWGENSLFFEPIGRKQGAVRVEVQSKDAPPLAPFSLVIEAEGTAYAPDLVRLRAEDLKDESAAFDETVYQALATLPKTDARVGFPGVNPTAVATVVKRSEKTVKRACTRLVDADRAVVTGTTVHLAKLYAVKSE